MLAPLLLCRHLPSLHAAIMFKGMKPALSRGFGIMVRRAVYQVAFLPESSEAIPPLHVANKILPPSGSLRSGYGWT